MQTISKQVSTSPVWEVAPLLLADDTELRLCHSDADAFRRMVDRAPQARKGIEIDLNKSTSHVSQILSGVKGVKISELGDFLDVCQNLTYLQKLLWDRGYKVVRRELTQAEKADMFDAITNERAELAQRSA